MVPGFFGADVAQLTRPAEAPALDSPELALGYAHRRARVFWFWWMGIVFALPGAAQALAQSATGQSPENGLFLLGLGLFISGLGWLASIAPRFTRKLPRPASDFARTEQSIRIAPGVAIGLAAAMLAIVVAFMTLMPRGMSPEALPVMAVLAAWPLAIGAGLLTSRNVHAQRERLHRRWLERTAAGTDASGTA